MESIISSLATTKPSLGVPRQRHVLTNVEEILGGPIRDAVEILSGSMAKQGGLTSGWQTTYLCRKFEPGASVTRPVPIMAAWTVVASWIVGISRGALPSTSTVLDAEIWFLGNSKQRGIAVYASERARKAADTALQTISDPAAFAELLPYLLDPHGPGSRLSVRRRPETQESRLKKRSEGVFYTPEDVATYMVDESFRNLHKDALPITVFDPACGTGVFLRAAFFKLRSLIRNAGDLDIVCSCLYGADIDPWALDATAFVLLSACLSDVLHRGISPLSAWHAIRLNLTHVDALRIDPGTTLLDSNERIARLECRTQLKAGYIPERPDSFFPPGRITLTTLFPEIVEGPRLFIGNPPYADLGPDAKIDDLRRIFSTAAACPKPSADIYPLFFEQMVRLAAPNSHAGALVLPLSIACNTGSQFTELRTLISRTHGSWNFAFFDREPHALFGEDVKTRNAIVFWSRYSGDTKTVIRTGPLRKWRGHSRAAMLKSIEFTEIETNIRQGIPKVDGDSQALALQTLVNNGILLRDYVSFFSRSTLSESASSDGRTVHIGATAYNFLNVFLRPHIPNDKSYELSEHHSHALTCVTENGALAVFACLSSRLAFWWWHVQGDGFHVTRKTLETLPIGYALSVDNTLNSLKCFGEELWDLVITNPIISVNRGRMSLGFSGAKYPDIQSKIDNLLVNSLGLDPGFTTTLQHFTERTTTAATIKNT